MALEHFISTNSIKIFYHINVSIEEIKCNTKNTWYNLSIKKSAQLVINQFVRRWSSNAVAAAAAVTVKKSRANHSTIAFINILFTYLFISCQFNIWSTVKLMINTSIISYQQNYLQM